MKKNLLLALLGVFITNMALSQITTFPEEIKIRPSNIPCTPAIPCTPTEPYGGYETFYPVGWSTDGQKIAYFTQGFTDDIGPTGSFNIFDLSTNKKTVFIFEESPEDDIFGSPQEVFEYFHDSINTLLEQYNISTNQEITYREGALLKIDNQRYYLHSEINIDGSLYVPNPDYIVYRNYADYANVIIIKEGIGLKKIFEFKTEEHNNKLLHCSLIEPLGILVSPNSKMAVVLSDAWSLRSQGGSDTSLMLVGFNLHDNYNW